MWVAVINWWSSYKIFWLADLSSIFIVLCPSSIFARKFSMKFFHYTLSKLSILHLCDIFLPVLFIACITNLVWYLLSLWNNFTNHYHLVAKYRWYPNFITNMPLTNLQIWVSSFSIKVRSVKSTRIITAY